MRRFMGPRSTDPAPSREEEFDALHMAYMRGAGLEKDPDFGDAAATAQEDTADAAAVVPVLPVSGEGDVSDAVAEIIDADELMRRYMLALVGNDASPVVARALGGFRLYGDGMFAQEMKVTKAPRKTLRAALRLLSYRWKNIIFLWEGFEAWPFMEQQTKLDIMAALNELRWLFGEYGVMGLSIIKGQTPELEEAFAGGEQVDWDMPAFQRLYDRDNSWDAELVQSWIDSASIAVPSVLRVDGAELAPLVAAAEDDVLRFALIAEAAFRDAAARGAASLDDAAIAAALASVKVEEGA